MLWLIWAKCFSAAASSENDHGSMNFASKTASGPSTIPSTVAAIQRITGCRIQLWTSLMTCPVVFSNQRTDEGTLVRLWHEKRGESDPPDYSDNLLVQLGVATEPLNRRNVGGQPPARTRR